VASRAAAGGGRWVEVDPARLPRWVDGFGERHGGCTASAGDGVVTLTGGDGETAALHPPPGVPIPGDLPAFLAAAAEPRRLGLLLVRRGGYAVGVARGERLTASKVDSRYVQSRTAAGGWSQQRFARRRDNQAQALVREATEVAVRILLAGPLDALVGGGDRALVERVLTEPRLAGLRVERLLEVADPRLVVLEAAVAAARAVHVRLTPPP
jgi:hypothetical protein